MAACRFLSPPAAAAAVRATRLSGRAEEHSGRDSAMPLAGCRREATAQAGSADWCQSSRKHGPSLSGCRVVRLLPTDHTRRGRNEQPEPRQVSISSANNQEVGWGKTMQTTAILYRDGKLVVDSYTRNDNWQGGCADGHLSLSPTLRETAFGPLESLRIPPVDRFPTFRAPPTAGSRT